MRSIQILAWRVAPVIVCAAIAAPAAYGSSPVPGDGGQAVGQATIEISGDLMGSYTIPLAELDGTRVDADGFLVLWSDAMQGLDFGISDLEDETLTTFVLLSSPNIEGSAKAIYLAPDDSNRSPCDVVIESLGTGVISGTADCMGLVSFESASHPVIDVHATFEARLPGAVDPSPEAPRGDLAPIGSSGAITLQAPSEWETLEGESTNPGTTLDPFILASADAATFHDAFVAAERVDQRHWAARGVAVQASRPLAQDLGIVGADFLDRITGLAEWHGNGAVHEVEEAFDLECAKRGGASTYSNVDETLDGYITHWSGCGPQQATLLDLGAVPDDGGFVVSALAVVAPGEEEFAMEVLRSIQVDGSKLP